MKNCMRFTKYHALGNDYIVLDSAGPAIKLTQEQIRRICHRNYGVGADGILCWAPGDEQGVFILRIFNPDGSEAEKSGNGLRIFARYLWENSARRQTRFSIITAGGPVEAEVHEGGSNIAVDMGRVSFHSSKIPVAGPPREVINEKMEIEGEAITYSAVTIGNPHCVVLCNRASVGQARRLGPLIERYSRFPNRTNVQFMEVMDRHNLRIEIWERGAGYTLSSGSSSCAAAAVAYRLGLCDYDVTVHMPGGDINIVVGTDYSLRMTGPVTKVFEGTISEEMFD